MSAALFADALLLLCSLAACGYCFILNRRLQRLADHEHGIGASIAQLSLKLNALQSAVAEAKQASHAADSALAERVAGAEQSGATLQGRIDEASLTLRKLDAALRGIGADGIDDVLDADDPNFDIVPRGFHRVKPKPEVKAKPRVRRRSSKSTETKAASSESDETDKDAQAEMPADVLTEGQTSSEAPSKATAATAASKPETGKRKPFDVNDLLIGA